VQRENGLRSKKGQHQISLSSGFRLPTLQIFNKRFLIMAARIGVLRAMEARREMRNLVVLLIGLSIAYWVDHTYYGGVHSRPVAEMLRAIANAYKSAG
jgi:hypothetical protein